MAEFVVVVLAWLRGHLLAREPSLRETPVVVPVDLIEPIGVVLPGSQQTEVEGASQSGGNFEDQGLHILAESSRVRSSKTPTSPGNNVRTLW